MSVCPWHDGLEPKCAVDAHNIAVGRQVVLVSGESRSARGAICHATMSRFITGVGFVTCLVPVPRHSRRVTLSEVKFLCQRSVRVQDG